MRDLRNDFLQEVKLSIMAALDPDDLQLVEATVARVLDKYEISERSTAIVPCETGNIQILKTYLSSLAIDGKSQKTIKAYSRGVRIFTKFIRNKDLKDTTTFDIRNYLAQKKVDGVSNTTLENIRSILSAFFQWMTAEEYIPKNPCAAVKPIKCPGKVRKPFSTVEQDVLRSNCRNEKERAIVEFLLSSGVRVSELVDLNVEDIDFNYKSVRIRHGKGDKERYTYIDDVARDHLIRYLTGAGIESGALFRSQRGRYTPHGIRTLLNVIAEKGQVENVHPHRFRRTFATTLAARGMDIQEIQRLMGHTNINTTMVYVALDDTQINHSYQKYTA